VGFLDDGEAQRFFRVMGIRESHGSRVNRRVRSVMMAVGNTLTNAVMTRLQSGAGSNSMLEGASAAWTNLCAIAQEAWQVLALHMCAFPWPDVFQYSLGSIIGIVSLNFEIGIEVGFELGFYVLTALALPAFALLMFFVVRDMRMSERELSERAEAQMAARLERLDAGERIVKLDRTWQEKGAWMSLFTLTTLYMPITRYAVIGAFCYRTIQCEFDCYNEGRHWRVVYVSAALFFCVTLMVPVILLWATATKRRQFLRNRVEESDALVSEDAALEANWRQFLVLDNSPYSGAYENFKFRWGYFQSEMVLSKALCVFLALGLDSNTTAQLVCLTLLHGLHTSGVALASPYVADISNLITMSGQVFVLLTLAVNAVSRLDPDENLGTYSGYFLMGCAGSCVVLQVYLISKTFTLRELVDGMMELMPKPVKRAFGMKVP
jgi:hypothetical protein